MQYTCEMDGVCMVNDHSFPLSTGYSDLFIFDTEIKATMCHTCFIFLHLLTHLSSNQQPSIDHNLHTSLVLKKDSPPSK